MAVPLRIGKISIYPKYNEIWHNFVDCWQKCLNDDCRFRCIHDFNDSMTKNFPEHEDYLLTPEKLHWTPTTQLPARENFDQDIVRNMVQQKYLKNVENSINNTISICGCSIIIILVIVIILLFYFHTK